MATLYFGMPSAGSGDEVVNVVTVLVIWGTTSACALRTALRMCTSLWVSQRDEAQPRGAHDRTRRAADAEIQPRPGAAGQSTPPWELLSRPRVHIRVAGVRRRHALCRFGAAAYVAPFMEQTRIFKRERADGLFSPFTFLLYRFLHEIGTCVLSSLFSSVLLFFAMKLRGAFAIFWLTYLACQGIGVMVASLIAAVSPSMDVANTLLAVYVVRRPGRTAATTVQRLQAPFDKLNTHAYMQGGTLYFGGFLRVMRMDAIPRYWQWLEYGNWLAYALGAQVINQFREQPEATIDGLPILQYYGMGKLSAWFMFCCTCAFLPATFVAAWLGLHVCARIRR